MNILKNGDSVMKNTKRNTRNRKNRSLAIQKKEWLHKRSQVNERIAKWNTTVPRSIFPADPEAYA
jgi:hypothetical protein